MYQIDDSDAAQAQLFAGALAEAVVEYSGAVERLARAEEQARAAGRLATATRARADARASRAQLYEAQRLLDNLSRSYPSIGDWRRAGETEASPESVVE